MYMYSRIATQTDSSRIALFENPIYESWSLINCCVLTVNLSSVGQGSLIIEYQPSSAISPLASMQQKETPKLLPCSTVISLPLMPVCSFRDTASPVGEGRGGEGRGGEGRGGEGRGEGV